MEGDVNTILLLVIAMSSALNLGLMLILGIEIALVYTRMGSGAKKE